ncbi:MAG: GGDEF domain-containing protein [Vitreimonas sp.]
MAQLSRYHIEPTPASYEVWFTHVSGLNRALSADIEGRLAKGEGFGKDVCAQLFERHLAKPVLSTQMLEASESLALELSDVVATLRSAGAESGSYAAALTEAATAFDGNIDPHTLRALVNGLMTATRDMAVRNRDLSQKMATSTQQVEALQTSLKHVKIEALTDALTGLANRRAFDERLRRHLQKGSGELCLLLCDIDNFKRFNDTWGHLLGDQVIRFIANILRAHAAGNALAARYGGEEFAIIMPATSMHRAQEIAGSILQAVKAKRLTRKSTGEAIGAVTVSIGLARRRIGETTSALVARADLCLYASKQGGRDRLTIDSDLPAAAVA